MKTMLTNLFLPRTAYRYDSRAVVISCFFNPTGSIYRRKAFDTWYASIKHLEHRIIELAIGDAPYELTPSPTIEQLRTETLLWHKESLLNRIISQLPTRYEYVFWVDADILFTNRNWLSQSIDRLDWVQVVQPFEFAIHLNQDETEPSFEPDYEWDSATMRQHQMWRSYGSNFRKMGRDIFPMPYDQRGHVGLAWGARRTLLDNCPLFDRALIGGGDGVIAYASAGDLLNKSVRDAFTDPSLLRDIHRWQIGWDANVNGSLSYTPGTVYHLWHGDIQKRNYLRRVQDFSPMSAGIQERDEQGLYVNNKPDATDYIRDYFAYREVLPDVTPTEPPVMFGGGDFGGAGAGGDYSDSVMSEAIPPTDTLSTVVGAGLVNLANLDSDPTPSPNWDSVGTIS